MERLEDRLATVQVSLRKIEVGLLPPDAVLIGPNRIRKVSTEFPGSRQRRDEMVQCVPFHAQAPGFV